jgi:hypothetical protein
MRNVLIAELQYPVKQYTMFIFPAFAIIRILFNVSTTSSSALLAATKFYVEVPAERRIILQLIIARRSYYPKREATK